MPRRGYDSTLILRTLLFGSFPRPLFAEIAKVPVNRRSMLSSTAMTLAIPGCLTAWAGDPPDSKEDRATSDSLNAALNSAGIATDVRFRTRHYAIIADAEHSAKIGRFCEGLLADALNVFRNAGLATRPLERRLNVVILDPEQFERISKQQSAALTQGFYDLKLRTCFLPLNRVDGLIDWDDTLTILGHEAIHQICYGSGLLNEAITPPACVSEGIAMLGEVSSWEHPRLLRQNNLDRLETLAELGGPRPSLLSDLWRDDTHFRGNFHAHQQKLDAYSWAWLLVYMLLTQDDLRPKFRDYLKTIARRKDKTHQIEDAIDHFGDLATLQDRMIAYLRRLQSRPPSKYSSIRRLPKSP